MLSRPGTAEQNFCSKLICKLCCTCIDMLFWINLLHSLAIILTNWGKHLLQSETTLLENGAVHRILLNTFIESLRKTFKKI